MSEIGIALVGLGEIALDAHLPALLRHPGIRLRALVDPLPQRRELAQGLVDAPAHPDLEPVLRDPSVHGVVLATPPWVSTGLAVTAARSGRFVLLEKPVATGSLAAEPLRALPAPVRDRIQVGLTYRHDPALALLHQWITEGRLGGSLLVRAHIYDERRDPGDPAHLRRIEQTLGHGMPVLHEGAHVFDWFAYLFGGGPQRVHDAWALATRPGLAAPNLCGARLDYPHGTTVLAEFGWFTGALPRCEISVLGDRGHALLDGRTFRLELSTKDGVELAEFEPDRTTRCFDRQVRRFAELIEGRSAGPEPSLDDGLAALELTERISLLATGTPV